ncbi:MAG: glutathione S-transferase family protein [Myxococcota bacterium]
MYQLYINTMSPYSSKASALIGYAGLECTESLQNAVNRFATIKRLTGKTMIPVLRRGEWAINDSTRIARYVQERTERCLVPEREQLHGLCWLLEDFADEWISKIVLASRWLNREDRREISGAIGQELVGGLPGLSKLAGRGASRAIRSQLGPGGISEDNRAVLERSRARLLQEMESLLEQPPPFLFCEHPTVADFAFYGQWNQFARDSSGAEVLRMYPNVRDYVERLDAMTLPHPLMRDDEPIERPLEALRGLFAEFLGTYWRVLVTNYEAMHQHERPERVSAEMLDGQAFTFKPSGYLVGRLEFVLEHIDRAYARRQTLFGEEGLEIEQGLVTQIARLVRTPSGRDLLESFPHIGAD